MAWASEAGGLEKAVPVLARAQAALPGCALFHFLHADMLETQGDAEGARQVRRLVCFFRCFFGGPVVKAFCGEVWVRVWVQWAGSLV